MDWTGGESHRIIRLYPILLSFYPTVSDIFSRCLVGMAKMQDVPKENENKNIIEKLICFTSVQCRLQNVPQKIGIRISLRANLFHLCTMYTYIILLEYKMAPKNGHNNIIKSQFVSSSYHVYNMHG